MVMIEERRLVDVYRFEVYDGISDNMVASRRWGTRDAIEKIARGKVLFSTQRKIDAVHVESPATDIPGMTARDFNPDAGC